MRSFVLTAAALVAGCAVTVPAPRVTVGWWYYPEYDVYWRGGVWWYYGVAGWVAVDVLPAWIVLGPGALRLRVDVPHRSPPYVRWSFHRLESRRETPRVWRPSYTAPTAPSASHRVGPPGRSARPEPPRSQPRPAQPAPGPDRRKDRPGRGRGRRP